MAIQAGNQCVFCLFQVLNGLILVAGLGLAALGIWLWIDTKIFSIIQIIFIGAGAFQFILSFIGCCSQKSINGIRFYYIFLWLIFIIQLVITILGFTLHQKLAEWIKQKNNNQDINLLQTKIWILVYYSLGTLVLFFITLLLASCYKSSLKTRNTDYRYKVYDQDLGKISLQQKRQKDDIAARDASNQKRQELLNKYPKYKQWKQGQRSLD